MTHTELKPPKRGVGDFRAEFGSSGSNVSTNAKSKKKITFDPSLPAAKRIGKNGKVIRLDKTDFYLKKGLRQKIPVSYLQHSTTDLLPAHEKEQRAETVPHKQLIGVVVSSGKMDKTVTVRVGTQTWNKRVKKVLESLIIYFNISTDLQAI